MWLIIVMMGLTSLGTLRSPDKLFAQNEHFRFERISLEQGLSQSTVHCLLQDSKGFMWFGTEDGLNKYDGYTFTVYKHDPENPNSLSSNYIWSIYEDQSGVLWIGTWGGGLNELVPNENKNSPPTFRHYKNDPNNPNSLSHNAIRSIYEDQSAVLWIGTEGGGLSKLDREKGGFTHYKNDPENPNSLSHDVVRSIYEDKSGTLWIGTGGGGLNKFDRETKIFTHYDYAPNNPDSLSHTVIWSISEDHSGMLWIGTEGGGLNKFDRETKTFTHYVNDSDNPYSLSHNTIRALYKDQSGILWIGTWGGGLNRFDPRLNQEEKQTFTHYKNDPDNSHSLSDNMVRSIYEDQSGVLWIGTEDGLNKFDRKKEKFAHYKHDPDSTISLSNNVVWSICEDRSGALWVGTWEGGLNRFDREKETVTHYKNDPSNFNSLSDNVVWSLYEDRSGTLWIGTRAGGLNRLVPNENEDASPHFIHYKNDPDDVNSLSHNNVRSIYEDQSGMLWIGTHGGGLNRFDRKRGIFIHYKNDPDNPSSLSNNNVWSILTDQAGVLWIGTWGGGLNKFVPGENKGSFPIFLHYKNDPNNPNSLSNNRVLSIYEDHNAVLWVGTALGLNKFDKETEKFTRYTKKNGLPNDVIYGILEDNHYNLWLSTNKGLSKFNLQTNTFKNYDIRDGLQSNEFNVGAYHKSSSPGGEMFFGGINGFNAFYPDYFKSNLYIPPIVITAFKKFDEIVLNDISDTDEIELSYKDKYLTFEFVALDFTNPEKNEYAFIMEGFDEDWNYSSSRRYASYTNLDPGDYTFRVKGSNNDGIWNEIGTSVKIKIMPQPWKTWWAYILYILVMIAALYGIRRYELNRMQLKNQLKLEQTEAEELKELDHLKSRFFTNISHEFRTPLTLILGPIENAVAKISDKSVKNQLNVAFENGHRLLRLVNQILELSKLEAGGMELKTSPENLIPFLKGIVFSFESSAKQREIILEFRSNLKALEVYYDAEKLEQVFYNLLSNAIKSSPSNSGGKISVNVAKSQTSQINRLSPNIEYAQITIKDTGIGIHPERLPHIFDRFYQVDRASNSEQEGTGIGLALAKEIVELHYGQISVCSKEGEWTEFIVTLPLGKEHLRESEIVTTSADTRAKHSDALIAEDKRERGLSVAPQQAKAVIESEAATIVLIVEDNPDVRAFVRQHLEPTYKVLGAANGQDGFDKAIATIPDLIISDVMMPKMGGYELCRVLKNDEKTSHIPVILLTAKADEASKLEGLGTGADDYLTKPFSFKELLLRVKNLIEQRRKLRVKFSSEIILKPSEIAITSMDAQFLKRVEEAVEKYIHDEDFSVEELCHQVGMSRVQLHRKLKALTNQSAGQFILFMRLQRAIDLLKENAGTVSEIAYMVGFNTPNYFAKCFRQQIGCSPSEYKKELKK